MSNESNKFTNQLDLIPKEIDMRYKTAAAISKKKNQKHME